MGSTISPRAVAGPGERLLFPFLGPFQKTSMAAGKRVHKYTLSHYSVWSLPYQSDALLCLEASAVTYHSWRSPCQLPVKQGLELYLLSYIVYLVPC